MWDEAAALDLRRKAEDYLREYKPGDYEPSERATADAIRSHTLAHLCHRASDGAKRKGCLLSMKRVELEGKNLAW
jgi:hypothetical protein